MAADHEINVWAIGYPIRTIRLSGDGLLVATASQPHTLIRLLEVRSGACGERK
jgi:hypothetical protein